MSEDGNVVKEDMYFVYGTLDELLRSSGDEDSREKFTGKEFDVEGGMNLYYFGARYYDPEAIMFTSPDPVGEFWNSYSYCGGNPVMLTDPLGLESGDTKSSLPEEIANQKPLNIFPEVTIPPLPALPTNTQPSESSTPSTTSGGVSSDVSPPVEGGDIDNLGEKQEGQEDQDDYEYEPEKKCFGPDCYGRDDPLQKNFAGKVSEGLMSKQEYINELEHTTKNVIKGTCWEFANELAIEVTRAARVIEGEWRPDYGFPSKSRRNINRPYLVVWPLKNPLPNYRSHAGIVIEDRLFHRYERQNYIHQSFKTMNRIFTTGKFKAPNFYLIP